MNKKFYITTPIYYPSGAAHIGHAYCTTLCDVMARYKRMRGYDTYFLTGTDEHGEKIQKNAALANKSPQEYVDEIASNFQKLWKEMYISNDDFIRTTQERHIKVVQDVFSKLLAKGDIYLGKYKGWYCTPCEAFWTDTQVGEDHLCPDCHRPVHTAEEEAYFYKANQYVPMLMDILNNNPKFVTPIERKNEMLNTFIKPGLDDLCVSRTSFNWGIPVKENPKHVVYVWLDALTNYISALGYDSNNDSLFQKYWQDPDTEIVHVIGADISRFHVIYWPMFLNSLGLRQPNRIIVHGLLMMKDGKMSKSKGNVISPYPLIERYGVDAVRYYLVREINFGSDGQFTPEQFVERINNDLANNIGNLLNRTVSMINKYFNGTIPSFESNVLPQDKPFEELINKTIQEYEISLDDIRPTSGFASVMEMLSYANKYIEETTPWVLSKENKVKELQSVMSHLAYAIFVGMILLKPVLVTKSELALSQLGLDYHNLNYEDIHNHNILNGAHVNKGEQLFPRLDSALEVDYIKSLMVK
jgi:methionyl-tRNA synthetase